MFKKSEKIKLAIQNRKAFQEFEKQLNIKYWEDWYRVRTVELPQRAISILLQYNWSLSHALSKVYPEYPWDFSKFSGVPKGSWKSLKNQRFVMDNVGKRLGISKWEDWYSVNSKALINYGAEKLLFNYDNSFVNLIRTVYPEYNWLPWKFESVPKGFWLNIENVTQYLHWVEEQLEIKELGDWYRVSKSQMFELGSGGLLQLYGGLIELLSEIYPKYPWKKSRIEPLKAQPRLFDIMKSIFPHVDDIHNEYPSNMYYPSGKQMIFDIFIPSLKLALEYQGEQHFRSFFNGTEEKTMSQQERDEEKMNACIKNRIALVQVPYWFPLNEKVVKALVHRVRPDLISAKEVENMQLYFPETPPKSFIHKKRASSKKI